MYTMLNYFHLSFNGVEAFLYCQIEGTIGGETIDTTQRPIQIEAPALLNCGFCLTAQIMPNCSVPLCKSLGGHKFLRDTKTFKHWQVAIKRDDPNKLGKLWTPAKNARVCHKHFDQDDYVAETYFTMNTLQQVICDADLIFMDVMAKWPGSVHDSEILRRSALFDAFEGNNRPINGFLLGDSGYRDWWLTPVRNPQYVCVNVIIHVSLSRSISSSGRRCPDVTAKLFPVLCHSACRCHRTERIRDVFLPSLSWLSSASFPGYHSLHYCLL